jgi:hypothetical protein
MSSRADQGEETQRLSLRAPDAVARWLLRETAADPASPDALAVVATHAYSQLRTHLAVFLGDQGFDALWRRAIHLAQREFPAWLDGAGAETPSPLPPGLGNTVCDDDAAETHARLLAVFASFIALLFTFIGAELGRRLIDQALLSDSADAPAQGALP